MSSLQKLPFEAIGNMAQIDHHRELRSGVPEVVFGESKSADEIATLLERLAHGRGKTLATRVSPDKAEASLERVPGAVYRADAKAILVGVEPAPGSEEVAVVSAGTSDGPVVEEAVATLDFLGITSRRVTDAGVAGLPRTIAAAERLGDVSAVIVAAGMEGALPSVLAGLCDRPLIAVPTSVGYGVGIGGFVAMMAMLSSCSPGVSVVNIDNGFGAAVVAARIVGLVRGSSG